MSLDVNTDIMKAIEDARKLNKRMKKKDKVKKWLYECLNRTGCQGCPYTTKSKRGETCRVDKLYKDAIELIDK